MGDDELVLECMQEEQNTFETRVFELLFGADARPPETVDERRACPPRVFSYEDAIEELSNVSKSLSLLSKLEEHYECPDNEEDDTQEAFDFRELVEQFRKEKEKKHGC